MHMQGRLMVRKYEKRDQVVEDHWLISRLGEGGFGEVWKAQTGAGTFKAIKIVDLSKPASQKEIKPLKIMTRVRHPHVCGIDNFWFKDRHGNILGRSKPSEKDFESSFDHLITGDETKPDNGETLVFPPAAAEQKTVPVDVEEEEVVDFDLKDAIELIIAMPFCDRSLEHELIATGNQGIPRGKLLRYMAEAASAIDYVNEEHNVQHRDIKPANLLLMSDSVMVADFGLAKDIHEVSTQTQLALTPAYAAPEQFDKRVSAATDQYALAITYVQLLTGKLPFNSVLRNEAPSLSELMRMRDNQELRLDDLPERDRAVIRKATAREPENRYASCTEMVARLADASATKPTKRRGGAPVSKPQLKQIGQWGAIVAGVLFLGVAAALVVRNLIPNDDSIGENEAVVNSTLASTGFGSGSGSSSVPSPLIRRSSTSLRREISFGNRFPKSIRYCSRPRITNKMARPIAMRLTRFSTHWMKPL